MVQSKLVEENGHLKRAILQLETEQTTIVCSMDLHSGANTETFEVTTHRYLSLGKFNAFDHPNRRRIPSKRDGRLDANIGKRGFTKWLLLSFRPFKTARARVKARKVYESHALCEEMLRQQQRHVL